MFRLALEDVKSVPQKGEIFICNPSPLSLLIVILLLPGIVFSIFVHVSAVREPVSKTYPCPVPSFVLR